MGFALRDYQDAAVVDVRVAFRDHQRVILVLSTGAGKTVIFSYIARSAAAKGKRILILAHRDQLIKQASRKLNDYDARHGIIMAGYTPDHTAKIQVASVQTLVRRLDKIAFEPDLIVIDEAHLSAAASYNKVLDRFPNAKVLGVTGSPCRLDNKPLGREYGGIYDHMVVGARLPCAPGRLRSGRTDRPVRHQEEHGRLQDRRARRRGR
jgi:superfamily II DNA or RNA helicase